MCRGGATFLQRHLVPTAAVALIMIKECYANTFIINIYILQLYSIFMQQKKQELTLPKKAIILAGGLGTRLRPLTLTVPKPLIPISENKVLVDLVIDILAKYGVKDVYLAISYLKNKFEDYFKDKRDLDVKIHYLHESTPMGTAGPLLILKNEKRQKELDDTFIMVNGDNLFNLDFRKKLKKAGFLRRDSRMKERKKYGLKKARRRPQWAKR